MDTKVHAAAPTVLILLKADHMNDIPVDPLEALSTPLEAGVPEEGDPFLLENCEKSFF
jgi:hypothetical protein